MGSTARRLFGGVLMGAGQGILQEAQQKREDVLRMLEEGRQDRIRAEDRAYEGGLLSNVVTGEDSTYGITRSGQKIDLGIKPRMTTAELRAQTDKMPEEDKRRLELAIQQATTGKGSMEGEQTDWNKARQSLIAQGRQDLADMLGPMEQQGAEVDVSSPEYTEAKGAAEQWADDKAGWLSSDKKDFAEYGGSRTEAIRRKTSENYDELIGRRPGGGQGRPSGEGPPAAQQAGGAKPSGGGTQVDPFVATTQAHIDWFKTSAPAGAVISVDGKLYTK